MTILKHSLAHLAAAGLLVSLATGAADAAPRDGHPLGIGAPQLDSPSRRAAHGYRDSGFEPGRDRHADPLLATPGITRRIIGQDQQIRQGRMNGTIERREARRLREHLRGIRLDLDAARADGIVTWRERRHLHGLLADNDTRIARASYAGPHWRHRWSDWRHGRDADLRR